MKKNHKSFVFTFLIFSTVLFCLLSCNLRAEQKSLTAQFDVIDALIMQEQHKAAIKELKKIEKRAYDSWSFIGIYKRYSKLGQSKAAEKNLKSALKKNDGNLELEAVYTHFLLENGRIDDAVSLGKNLQGTKYGSLYSEAILRQAAQKNDVPQVAFYNDKPFYNIYFDAYNGSRNPVWLRNCAVFNLSRGLYENAAELNPSYYANADDAFFWSLVLYDGGRFFDAINTLETTKKLLEQTPVTSGLKVSKLQIAAIEADAYLAISDAQGAEQARQSVLVDLDNLQVGSSEESILPILLVNSAIYAKNNDLNDNCADLLFYTVNRWPNFIPGLVLYADFAFESSKEPEEDDATKALRQNGLKTLEMERYDSRRKIPVSDASYRIEQALQQVSDPYLYLAQLDLKYKLDTEISVKEKTQDLWTLLEDNYDETEKYKTVIVQYSINFLLKQKLYNDAWRLFVRYVCEHCKIDEDGDFWKQFIEQMNVLELPVVEQAGLFATDLQKTEEALRVYEYCVYESGGVLEEGLISPSVSIATCMNLADLYFSTGKKEKALDLYGKAAGRESNAKRRSEIFYRIGCIYYSLGDIKNALHSADYACLLYPENARAALLKDRVSIQ